MSRFTVRTLCSEDFGALRQLEVAVFGAAGEDVLCPHHPHHPHLPRAQVAA